MFFILFWVSKFRQPYKFGIHCIEFEPCCLVIRIVSVWKYQGSKARESQPHKLRGEGPTGS